MMSRQRRSDYTMFSVYHLLAAVVGFLVPFVLGFLFNFGSYTALIASCSALAFFFWIPPVKRKDAHIRQQTRAIIASLPEPIDTDITEWDIPRARGYIESALLPRVWDQDVKLKARRLLQDAGLVHHRFEDLVDFPEHTATVKGVVRQWVPKTLRLFIHSETASAKERERAIHGAMQGLEILHKEVLRIKAAIVQGDLMDLEAHATVLEKYFGPDHDNSKGKG